MGLDWFEGLSDHFLGAPCLKLLVVAGTNRLVDKKLLIGQMQGKFQLSVLSPSSQGTAGTVIGSSGGGLHAIHEEFPKELAQLLFDHWSRFSKPIPTLNSKLI